MSASENRITLGSLVTDAYTLAPVNIYPRTKMTVSELLNAEASAPWGDERDAVANAAIARAIQDGQVLTIEQVEELVRQVLNRVIAIVPLEARHLDQACADITGKLASLRAV